MGSRWLLPVAAALLVLTGLGWVTGLYPQGILTDLTATTIRLHTPAGAGAFALSVPPVASAPLVEVLVPPGAEPVPPQPGMSWSAGITGSPYSKVGFSSTYRVPAGAHAAAAWIGRALWLLGYREVAAFSGSSNINAQGPYTVHQREYTRFVGVGQPPENLVVNLRSLGQGASLVRYVASVFEDPPRPARTYVTGPVRSADISEGLAGSSRRISRHITNPAALARITQAANALSIVTTAPFLCPAITYTIHITLVTARGSVSIVDEDNCGAVEVRGVWLFDPSQRFNRALSGLGLAGVGR